jgi:hypothetical protein
VRPSVGVGVGPAAPGGPASRGRPVAGRNPSAIGGGSRCRLCRIALIHPSRLKARRPGARASAQQQFPRISRSGVANALVATRCSGLPRSFRGNAFAAPCAVERCGTCSIGKRGIDGVGDEAFGRGASVLGRRHALGCDVFTGSKARSSTLRSPNPQRRRQRAGRFSAPRSFPMGGVLGEQAHAPWDTDRGPAAANR